MQNLESIKNALQSQLDSINWSAPWEEINNKLASIRGIAMKAMVELNREYINSIGPKSGLSLEELEL
jgi:hypothetical protein